MNPQWPSIYHKDALVVQKQHQREKVKTHANEMPCKLSPATLRKLQTYFVNNNYTNLRIRKYALYRDGI